MSENCICLSSDEDEPREKKRKVLNPLDKPLLSDTSKSVISLVSDDENESESQNIIVIDNKENVENNTISSSEKCDSNQRKNNSSHFETEALECNSLELEKPENGTSPTDVIQSEEVNEFEGDEINNVISSDDANVGKIEHNEKLNMEGLTPEAILFLKTCENQLNVAKRTELVAKKFPSFIKLFRKISDDLSESDYLKVFLEKHTLAAAESLRSCLINFKEVYEYLKEISNCEGIELPKNQSKQAKRLEKAIRQVLAQIKELEQEEVDLEADESNSPYIKLDRYTRHLDKLHKKYCQILKKNPYAGRITYERIDFMSSSYNEINLAICKNYKNNKIFPNYEDIYLLIKTVVEEKELPLNEAQIKAETNHCFKVLGELLQQRRKKELYESHCLMATSDPALKDEELEVKLKKHAREAKIKMEQIHEEFVKKQDLGGNEAEECSEDNPNDSSSDGDDDAIPPEIVEYSFDKNSD